MIDVISGGRLIAGFPVGTPMDTCYCYGQNPSLLRERYLEAHDLVMKAWQEADTFAFNGRFNQQRYVNIWPRPVQRPHPPFLVSAQSEETLRWAARHDIPFAQIDSLAEQARDAAALYRDVQMAHGHAPAPQLYLMREIYVGESDAQARAEAEPWMLQQWQLWNRYTQFTRGGELPESYDFWRRQAPMLHAMGFDEIVAKDMVILGGPERVAEIILRLAGELDLMGLALIFKLGAMPYDMVEWSMTLFGEEVMPRIRHVLDRAGDAAPRAA